MNEIQKKKRPIWVWIISAYYFLSCGFTLLSFVLIYLNIVPLDEAKKAYFEGLSIIDYLNSLSIGVLGLIGTIYFFLLKKQSVKIFGAVLALNIIATIWQLFKTNLSEVLGGPSLVGMFIGFGFNLGVFLYTRNLGAKGQLQ